MRTPEDQRTALARLRTPEAMAPGGDCWEWPGPRNVKGYGVVAPSLIAESPTRLAHRNAYRIAVADPGDLLVCHRCDNPGWYRPRTCSRVRPQRTPRTWFGRVGSHGAPPRPRKLNDAEVAAVRAERERGARLVDLAPRYGVSSSFLSRLTRGQRRAQ